MDRCVVCGFTLNDPSRDLWYIIVEGIRQYYCHECNKHDRIRFDYHISKGEKETNGSMSLEELKIDLYLDNIYYNAFLEEGDPSNIKKLADGIFLIILHEYLHFFLEKNLFEEYKVLFSLSSASRNEEERIVSILSFLLLNEVKESEYGLGVERAIKYGDDYLNNLRYIDYTNIKNSRGK